MGYSKRQPTRTLITSAVFVIVVITIALLYFFFIPQNYFDPSFIKLQSKCKSCAKAKALAIEDFEKGNYHVVAWGLTSSESPTLKIAEILERDYKIKTVFGGCVREEALECYDTQMRRLLVTKLSKTFYKRAYEQVINNSH
ncbi:hypothetical protein [Desertivirga brevis]|uniref:hypothetical protein n=1 Tax=Desertivirga brevis TaxID=2810310 RepID=UPI001A978184|nr:hypothetical protein [Pedobacter sp. SYSU D00873]